MKFAVKHPQYFRYPEDELEEVEENEDAQDNLKDDRQIVDINTNLSTDKKDKENLDHRGMRRRAIFAFLLGFLQFTITTTAQMLIMLLLFRQIDVVNVMVKFSGFTGITKFDDFFSSSITENPAKKAIGKILDFQFKRKMSEVHPEDKQRYKDRKAKKDLKGEHEQQLLDADEVPIRNVIGEPLVEVRPWQKSIVFRILFYIFKTLRIYFVAWGYYFTPVTALLLNIYFNLDLSIESI